MHAGPTRVHANGCCLAAHSGIYVGSRPASWNPTVLGRGVTVPKRCVLVEAAK